jgi:hypothetical protein
MMIIPLACRPTVRVRYGRSFRSVNAQFDKAFYTRTGQRTPRIVPGSYLQGHSLVPIHALFCEVPISICGRLRYDFLVKTPEYGGSIDNLR